MWGGGREDGIGAGAFSCGDVPDSHDGDAVASIGRLLLPGGMKRRRRHFPWELYFSCTVCMCVMCNGFGRIFCTLSPLSPFHPLSASLLANGGRALPSKFSIPVSRSFSHSSPFPPHPLHSPNWEKKRKKKPTATCLGFG